jgi:hypothetical protein
MSTYASSTDVSSSRSREEIERTLMRFGATDFAYGWNETRAILGFVINGRQVRFTLPMPDRKSPEFTLTPAKRFRRTPEEAAKAYEQAVRSKWRSLAIVIKAKLVAVSDKIVTFEQEFGMHMVLPDGRTVAETVIPEIAHAYASGQVKPMLQIGAPE